MESVVEQHKTYWVLNQQELYEGKRLVIDWTSYNLNGLGNKHLRYYLMLSVKSLVKAYILRQEQKNGSISSRTIYNWNLHLRIFVKWMVKNEIWSFSKLGGVNNFV